MTLSFLKFGPGWSEDLSPINLLTKIDETSLHKDHLSHTLILSISVHSEN